MIKALKEAITIAIFLIILAWFAFIMVSFWQEVIWEGALEPWFRINMLLM